MSGFDNDVVYGKNADFTTSDNQDVNENNGLVEDGKLWIGSTALNVGGTHINVGSLVCSDGSVSIEYVSPNLDIKMTGIQCIRTETVDMKSTGVTPLFTPTADFIVLSISFVGVDITGTIGLPTMNFGWTASSYNDLANGNTSNVSATDRYCIINAAFGVVDSPILPSGSTLNVNVTSADATATTNTQRIDIIGYYVS